MTPVLQNKLLAAKEAEIQEQLKNWAKERDVLPVGRQIVFSIEIVDLISCEEWSLLEGRQGRANVFSKLRESGNQPIKIKELGSSRTKNGLVDQPFTYISQGNIKEVYF